MAFEALLGNDRLKKNLTESLAKKHISHFYLISGPEGSGKHTWQSCWRRQSSAKAAAWAAEASAHGHAGSSWSLTSGHSVPHGPSKAQSREEPPLGHALMNHPCQLEMSAQPWNDRHWKCSSFLPLFILLSLFY